MRPPGLYSQPAQLAFTCVTPGCSESITARLTVSGDRRVAIKRLLLSGTAASDFSFTSSERPPFIIGAGAGFDVTVTYAPKGAPAPGSVALLATFTDASPDESDMRLPPGELSIPLVRRLVGEPILKISPERLSYGFVAVGTRKSLPLTLSNVGFGNVELEIGQVDAGSVGVSVDFPDAHSMAPDASIVAPTTWKPTTEGYMSAEIAIPVVTPGIESSSITVEGTSLPFAKIALQPDDLIDFGELPKARFRRTPLTIINQGGDVLHVNKLVLGDISDDLKIYGPDGGLLTVQLQGMRPDGGTFDGGFSGDGGPSGFDVPGLGRTALSLEFGGVTPGELNADLKVYSSDTQAPVKSVTVRGTVTQPEISVGPASVDFGVVPIGWVLNKSIELRNTGFGTLTVRNISFVGGSSALYTLTDVPGLPLTLARNSRVALNLQFRGETVATFNASLSVETDDPLTPFKEVPITARVGTCTEGCPILHGTPDCSAGTCSVGTCNTGWYDTDKSAATGCECQEVGTDPGAFCSAAQDLGQLTDNDNIQRSYSGVIPTADDIDMIRFFGYDGNGFFSDDFNVKVRLQSSDPGIQMCVYRHRTGSHQTDCFLEEETCPQNRYYERDGSYGTDDSADFTIKVTRVASTAPTCTSYTVFASNGL